MKFQPVVSGASLTSILGNTSFDGHWRYIICGLVGVVNKWSSGFTKDQQEIFSTLLYLDYLRGNDSTGVFAIHNNGDVLLAKEASNPDTFMHSKEYDNIMKKVWTKGNALIGHNRKATRGTVNDENAHPFVVDDRIVLVHNGTMHGDHKKMADVEVDSHAIAHIIHEKGNVQEALSSFNAAYALIWYDFEHGTLNFIRNSQRPLWWMETHSSYVWSSEKCMLDFVVARMNLHLKEQPTELSADVHQIFTLKNNMWGSESAKLDIKPTYTPYVWPEETHSVVQLPVHHRRNQYANAWEDVGMGVMGYDMDDDGDIVDVPTEPVTGAQLRANQVPSVLRLTGPNLAGAKGQLTTSEFERELASKMNKVVTSAQFAENILKCYPMGSTVVAITFDYCYANQKDETGGFFLYSALGEDPDIILRHYFDLKYTTEERIVQIASGEYVYKYEVGRKRWMSYNPMHQEGNYREAPGYVIIEGERAVLMEGGGMVNPQFSGGRLH